jgi:hypothetical protein
VPLREEETHAHNIIFLQLTAFQVHAIESFFGELLASFHGICDNCALGNAIFPRPNSYLLSRRPASGIS